jgi:hypothetical protein
VKTSEEFSENHTPQGNSAAPVWLDVICARAREELSKKHIQPSNAREELSENRTQPAHFFFVGPAQGLQHPRFAMAKKTRLRFPHQEK